MILYIWGNRTIDNFTPRLGKDTVGRPGQQAGLSASARIPNWKAQAIDTDEFRGPLKAIPDDVAQGGTAGHFSIAPIDANGQVDLALLEAWARTRGSGKPHELTEILLEAVVGAKPKRKY